MDWATKESELKRRRIGHTFRMKKRGKLLHEGRVVAVAALRHWHGDYVHVLERLMFTKGIGRGTEEVRLCYYDGRKFRQYAAVLPEQELRKLLQKAKREGV